MMKLNQSQQKKQHNENQSTNKIETRKITEKSMKPKVCFFEKINNIDTLLNRLTKEEKR